MIRRKDRSTYGGFFFQSPILEPGMASADSAFHECGLIEKKIILI